MQINSQAAFELGRSMPSRNSAMSSTGECHLSQSDCNIESMSGATTVYTDDDNSRCLNGDGFAFLVKPGASDKLLFFMPGGGACWKGSSSNGELCTEDLAGGLGAAGLGSGVTENRADNSFADWTFVAPAYCDGGAFVSNSTLSGKPQNGYTNTKYAVDWAKRNLNQNLANFVISGSSAGALGTMAWAHELLSTFQYSKATAIIDSYMGVFPEGTQGPTIKNFGACSLPIFKDFRDECEAGAANIQDVFDYAISMHPTVAFSMIQPKWDIVQRLFYAAIAFSYRDLDLYINAVSFYEETNDHMQRYSRHHNFVWYYVDGPFHTFLQGDFYYSATVTGFAGLLGTGGKPTLANWTNALIEHQPVQSACNGGLERNGGTDVVLRNTRYCYDALYPKVLSVIPPTAPVERTCTDTRKNPCTAHPIDWYQPSCSREHGSGYEGIDWEYCAGIFGGRYVCQRTWSCAQIHGAADCCR